MGDANTECARLDFRAEAYPSCRITTIPGTNLRCWQRDALPYPEAPAYVQFCGEGRGRINDPFACHRAPGPCGCYVAPAAREKEGTP